VQRTLQGILPKLAVAQRLPRAQRLAPSCVIPRPWLFALSSCRTPQDTPTAQLIGSSFGSVSPSGATPSGQSAEYSALSDRSSPPEEIYRLSLRDAQTIPCSYVISPGAK